MSGGDGRGRRCKYAAEPRARRPRTPAHCARTHARTALCLQRDVGLRRSIKSLMTAIEMKLMGDPYSPARGCSI